MNKRRMLALVLALAGCSSPTVEPDLTERPQPAAFDLALVKMHFTDA